MNGPLTPYILAGGGLVVAALQFFLGRLIAQQARNDAAQWRRIDEQQKQVAQLETRMAVLEALIERAEKEDR